MYFMFYHILYVLFYINWLCKGALALQFNYPLFPLSPSTFTEPFFLRGRAGTYYEHCM